MATQEQVNIEVGNLFGEMAEYTSRKVQGSDTFSGLSGNQHAELASLAKDLNVKIAEVDGTAMQKAQAVNEITNEIAKIIVDSPNSPYYQKYTPQQINVLAMQSVLGGHREYVEFGNQINDTILDFNLKIQFLDDFIERLGACYGLLNGNESVESTFLRRNGESLLLKYASDKIPQIDESLNSLGDLKSYLADSVFVLSEIAKSYYNVNESVLSELGYISTRLNPLPVVIIPMVKVVGWTATACASAWMAYWTKEQIVDMKAKGVLTRIQEKETIRLGFCLNTSKALEALYASMESMLRKCIELNSDKKLMLKLLLEMKMSEAYGKLLNLVSDKFIDPTTIKLLSDGKEISFNYAEDCIQGQIRNNAFNALSQLPDSERAIDRQSAAEDDALVKHLAIACGGLEDSYEKAAKVAEEARRTALEESGLEDAARRRRAVTNLIEWATYGAVGVGVIWGLSKVYKGYKSDD